MEKLIFFYGAMKAGKGNIIIPTAYNLEENKRKVLLVKPGCDDKGGNSIISRAGASRKVDLWIREEESFLSEEILQLIFSTDVILVDEVQFLTAKQIEELWAITKKLNIQVIGFGLKGNFKGELFEGSKRLIELADEINEMPLMPLCSCGNKARYNARKVNGEFTMSGEEKIIDGKDNEIEYVSLCGECFFKEVVQKEKKMKYLKKLQD